LGQYADLGYQLIRQHSFLGTIDLVAAGAGLSARHQ
jgi:hypothetical protein